MTRSTGTEGSRTGLMPPPLPARIMGSIGAQLNALLLWVGAGVVLSPLLIVLISSLAPPGTLPAAIGAAVIQQLSLASYQQAWTQGHLLQGFANSTLVALVVTGTQLITSALAGYALARSQFRGRQIVLVLVLATLVIPFQLLVMPVFLVLRWAGLINTYAALMLPTAANGFGIFLMRQYFQSIPVAIEEAAAIDGANRWQILGHVMLPLAQPALITLFLLTFIGEWNDVFKPLVLTTRPELATVQLLLTQFQEQYTNDWPLLMAAVVISTLPVVVLFLIGQRQFMQGIATTGVKD